MARFHYTQDDIVTGLRKLGIQPGDVLFSHVSLLNLGFCRHDPVRTLLAALKTVLGESGSFITPAFSYSFCDGEDFDLQHSKSAVGVFSQRLLTEYALPRSADPIFSVTGFGPHIKALFADLPPTSFGQDCLYQRLHALNAKICNIGLSLFYLTPIHYLEQSLNVPYRFNKRFAGHIIDNGERKPQQWDYYVRYLTTASEPNCTPLQQEGKKRAICHRTALGLGEIHLAPMVGYFQLAAELIREDPWFLVAGPAFDPHQV